MEYRDITTVDFAPEGAALYIVDQTRLPGELVMLTLSRADEIFEAIFMLRVRGAPAIGVAAAIGMYAVAAHFAVRGIREYKRLFRETKNYLASSRPTAVNLSWALDRMGRIVDAYLGDDTSELTELLRIEAQNIRDEDIAVCRAIGEFGLLLLNDGDGILTHCNAGELAAVKYGTALAPIHIGKERGYTFHVFADETRPLLQGIRLTAFELAADGIDVTVICDNMAAQVISEGKINAVLVGSDRIAANGDVCNKIGTSGVAILARHFGIPFYVAAPSSTIDKKSASGREIPIEQRSGDEITELHYTRRMAPHGVRVYNPAFDVTDNGLVSAIITEKGVFYPPYNFSE